MSGRSLTFTGPGSDGGLQAPGCDWPAPSTARWRDSAAGHKQARKFLRSAGDLFLAGDPKAREGRWSAYKHGRTEQGCKGWERSWLQWPWDGGIHDPGRRKQGKKQDHSTGIQESRVWLVEDLVRWIPCDTALETESPRRVDWFSRITSSNLKYSPSQHEVKQRYKKYLLGWSKLGPKEETFKSWKQDHVTQQE